MKTYGYIRPSASKSLSEQLKELSDYNCDNYFVEEGSDYQNQEFERLLKIVKENDRIIVMNVRSLEMTIQRFGELLAMLNSMQIELISVEDKINSIEKIYFHEAVTLLVELVGCESIIKKIEREQGRPPIDKMKVRRIRFLYHENKMTMREIANACEVSLGTVHKYLNQE